VLLLRRWGHKPRSGQCRSAFNPARILARPQLALIPSPPGRAVGSTTVTDQDFATTLRDGRRVIGRREGSEWSIHVYSPDRQSRLLGYGVAATRPDALERAGLTGEDAGEVLGRIGF
jgi:hypothetical protein